MSIDFQTIHAANPLLDYCRQRGMHLSRAGLNWIAKCPIHQERNGHSFVIHENRWTCFGKCGRHGDVIDLEQALGGGTLQEAIQRLSGVLSSALPVTPSEPKRRETYSSWPWPKLLRFSSPEEIDRLAEERNISAEACRLAEARGLLRFLDHQEGVAWVVTDCLRQNAVARLLGGQLWKHRGKAKTLPRALAKRPIGGLESIPFPCIAIVEGGPDLLAAMHFILQCGTQELVAPVCMTSTNSEFLPDDLEQLRGKPIRLFPHADDNGRKAAIRWCEQLKAVTADIQITDLRGFTKSDGSIIKDVNDLTQLSYETWDAIQADLEGIMVFEGRSCI